MAGVSSLTDVEQGASRRTVGEVAGLEVIHLQRHIGFDSISLAREAAISLVWTSRQLPWHRPRRWLSAAGDRTPLAIPAFMRVPRVSVAA